jgi:His/Glu/Gln/Arg/opine family amino acid ABC transporter permease subunit
LDKTRLPFLLVSLFLWLAPTLLAQEKKPLKCGTDTEGGVPYYFRSPDDPNQSIGFEIDLIAALEKELGRPIEYEHSAFETMFETLNRGDKFNFAMNGLEISRKNLSKARFTRPYYIYRLQLVARADDNRFTTLEECKQKGLVVSTIENSAAHELLDKMGVPFTIFPDQEGPFNDLVNKRVDAVLFDTPITTYYVIQDDQIKHRKRGFPGLKLVGESFAEGYYGIAVRSDDETLQKELDAALGRVIDSGELKRILVNWHLWSPDQYRLYTSGRADSASASSLGFAECLWFLVKGAMVTVVLTIASMALAVALGLPIATMRLYGPPPVRWLAIGYVEFFRGIPVLLLLVFIYFALPQLTGINLSPHVAAILGFGLNYAAYEAEIYRNGIQSIPVGQWEAGASLGMSPLLTFRRIIFPQSIRVILPPMTNDFIALFKDTSVVSVIGVIELTKQYQILTKSYGDYLRIGLTTAALYLIMSVPLGYLSRYLEKRWGAK